MTERRLRSSTHTFTFNSPTTPPDDLMTPFPQPVATSPGKSSQIKALPYRSPLPHLPAAELKLFRKKQKRLLCSTTHNQFSLSHNSILKPPIHKALAATLIFAQHEAGTAVCVHPHGWVLTCSHCFGESADEWKTNKCKWLLSYTGLGVLVECRVWDGKRDLALAKIIAIESNDNVFERERPVVVPAFAFVTLSKRAPAVNTRIVCIGQPGAEDLEAEGKKQTKYNLIELSEGRFRGMIKDVDPQDNSEIGALKHDAWTYWGHSGAPLVREDDGMLVGLHSSWDDQTAMRHGIAHVALKEFLKEHMERVMKETREEFISVYYGSG